MAAPSTAQSVLSVERLPSEGGVYLRLQGVINETFDPARFGDLGDCAVLDLGGVRSITSFGVRKWRDFVSAVPQSTHLYLLDCPPCIVDQINLVLNFCGPAEVLSARAPYFCPKCEKDVEVRFDLLNQQEVARSAQPGPQYCPTCNGELEGESEYFRFAPKHAAKSLQRAAARMLGLLGVYSGQASEHRPLDVQKLVEGSVTLFKLTGTVDGKFRPRRLVEGVEGTVVVLLSSANVASDGVPAWNQFHGPLVAQASEVVLVDLPYAIVELADRGQVDLGKAIVHSVQLPFFCQSCLEIQSFALQVMSLQRALPPGGPCQRCGRETAPIEGMVSLESLRARAQPTPPVAKDAIDRANELFSMAHVEAVVTQEHDSVAGDKTQIGGYRIIRPLSAGGMAQVFLAARSSLGGFEKPVALKLFRRSLIESSRSSLGMFLKEAKICARLSHPNIVQIFDVGEAGGDLYMAMEYIDGRDTGDILERNRAPLPVPVVLHVAEKVLEALDYAHNAKDLTGTALNIVHRDVSLQNILVNFDGWVKLIDFGIALAGEQRMSSEVAGNVCYMSPEQCSGRPLDGRSDLFSLGVVLWEMLTGRYLFRRPTIEQTLSAMLTADIPPLENVPEPLAKIVMRALEREVENRWQSAKEMGAAMREAALSCGPPVDPHGLSSFVRGLFPAPTPEAKAVPFAATLPQIEETPSAQRAAAALSAARPSAPAATPSQPVAAVTPTPPAVAQKSPMWPWLVALAFAVMLVLGAAAWILLSP